MKTRSALDIVRLHIRMCGGDGLANPDIECGCTLDDFAPCHGVQAECIPARDVGPRHGSNSWMVPVGWEDDETDDDWSIP